MSRIRGHVVTTPVKRPDFNQTNPKKSDYIKNNPLPQLTEEDEGKLLVVKDGKYCTVTNSFVEGEGLSVRTINGGKLKFFVGTKDEFEALSAEEKADLFALFTDDTSKAEFDTLKTDVEGLKGNIEGFAGHKHSASDITSGYIPFSRLDTIPISKGGTGQKTADAALYALGGAKQNHTHTEYAAKAHGHPDLYASKSHTHSEYSLSGHTHSNLAASVHNHDGTYVKKSERVETATYATMADSVIQLVTQYSFSAGKSVIEVTLADGCYIFRCPYMLGTGVLWVASNEATVSSIVWHNGKYITFYCAPQGNGKYKLTMSYLDTSGWKDYTLDYDLKISLVPLTTIRDEEV